MIRNAMITIVGLLAATAAAGAQPLYTTGTSGNQIWEAEADGSGTPAVLYENAGPRSGGRRGIDLDAEGGRLFWATGEGSEFWTAPADGSGSPTVLYPNLGGWAFDVAVDAPGNRLFMVVEEVGVFVGSLDGLAPATLLYPAISPRCVAYEPSNDKIYWDDVATDNILVGEADGSSSSVLISNSVGFPSDIAIDAPNNSIYWVKPDSGQLVRAPLDGIGDTTLITTDTGGTLYAMDIDVEAGRIYLCEFDHPTLDDAILTWDIGVSVFPALLHSGDFGDLRGIVVGPQPESTCGADVNGDGAVDAADLSVLIGEFGRGDCN